MLCGVAHCPCSALSPKQIFVFGDYLHLSTLHAVRKSGLEITETNIISRTHFHHVHVVNRRARQSQISMTIVPSGRSEHGQSDEISPTGHRKVFLPVAAYELVCPPIEDLWLLPW